jgi:predicted DNA-binding transcriptional regulator AlpA
MEKVLYDVRDVSDRYSLSTRTIYRMIDAGAFPKPIKCGSLNRWHINDLKKWENTHEA